MATNAKLVKCEIVGFLARAKKPTIFARVWIGIISKKRRLRGWYPQPQTNKLLDGDGVVGTVLSSSHTVFFILAASA